MRKIPTKKEPSLAEDSHVIIDLSSIDGKKLMTITNENYSQGDHKLISTDNHFLPEFICSGSKLKEQR